MAFGFGEKETFEIYAKIKDLIYDNLNLNQKNNGISYNSLFEKVQVVRFKKGVIDKRFREDTKNIIAFLEQKGFIQKICGKYHIKQKS